MSKKGLKRDTTDKFYTKKNISKLCITEFVNTIHPKKSDTIIEPSAGNGSFSNYLLKLFKNVYSFDLYPEADHIIKQDFLLFDVKKEKYNSKIHTIGNPPFGRQSSTAKKFIKHSCSFSETISFILPKSFKKESFQKTFPLNFHLVKSIDLPKNSFTVEDIEYDVPCVFQIWKKLDNERQVSKSTQSVLYKYVKQDEQPDVSIRRVGVYAGKIDKDCSKSSQSHYFLKIYNDIDNFIEKYLEIVFEKDNTVGPRSISKKELDEKILEIFEK